MAFLEWRRFTFFDVHNNADEGKIGECLQDTQVTAATSGNGHVILCDVTGWAHLISRSWELTSFKAYEVTVTLAQQFPHDPYLVTIGEDAGDSTPLLKVWDWSRRTRGAPACCRVARAVPAHLRPVPATALAVCETKKLLAIGFKDGSVVLLRGDAWRQRAGRLHTLPDTAATAVTGLFFKGADQLFIVSRASVHLHNVTSERTTAVDRQGAPPHCAALSTQLMLATPPAIYCYTSEGRGPCYALEGEKVRLDWFRNYLVITTKESTTKHEPSTSQGDERTHYITILDIENKFIVFSRMFDEIDTIITEWGSLYILTKNKELIYLDEKDLQSKLTLLFKKNLYDVAIRIASGQHYDAQGLIEIYKQYGDHLYAKGDLKGAIEQYVKTIGWLETSYVIRKYLECRHLEPLTVYLEELHRKRQATEDHTSLLLTCYIKIDQFDQQGKLKEFINSKDSGIEFDVDVAIKVVRQVSPADALALATARGRHDAALSVMLDDMADYARALDYIAELEFPDAVRHMTQYGAELVEHAPDDATELLTRLCTGWRPRSAPLPAADCAPAPPPRAPALPLRRLYHAHPRPLLALLRAAAAARRGDARQGDDPPALWEETLQLLLHLWQKTDSGAEKQEYSQEIMTLLRAPPPPASPAAPAAAARDPDRLLVACQAAGFRPGLLYLLEERKLYRAQLSLQLRTGAPADAPTPGAPTPDAPADAPPPEAARPELAAAELSAAPAPRRLAQLLDEIQRSRALSPAEVVDRLARAGRYTLGDVRSYLTGVLRASEATLDAERALCASYRAEGARAAAAIERLLAAPVVLQRARCSACSRALALPAVHMLCSHSYHQNCFRSYSERGECPQCAPPAPRPAAPPSAESLHARLLSETDPYAVVSEYFGRGLFNKIAVVTDGPASPAPAAPAPAAAPAAAAAPVAAPTWGPGAEARLRLQEGHSTQLYRAEPPRATVPERARAASPEPLHHRPPSAAVSAAVSAAASATSSAAASPRLAAPAAPHSAPPAPAGNPFGDEDAYDEAKNPFEGDEPSNPFGDDDEYDKNLNPFA